jgi:HlyD family secretion protein
MPSKIPSMARRIGIGILLAAGAATIAFFALRPTPPNPIIGMVRATEVKIAPEVSGRIAALPVKAGDRVTAGAIVAELSNPELAAAVTEAEAAVLEARATRDRAYAGIRQEEVDIAAQNIEKARADLTLAKVQLKRASKLAATGAGSQQQLDDARAAEATASARLAAAQLRHAEAESGPTIEERAVADAGVVVAEASLAVLKQRLEKLQIKSPTNGAVEVVVGELGEATVPGRAILTIADTGKPWFSFNIREDQLRSLSTGTQLTLVNGKDNQRISAQVSEMRRLGDFATWRAARAIGDHDLNTFFIRAGGAGNVGNLEPGVTVWIADR